MASSARTEGVLWLREGEDSQWEDVRATLRGAFLHCTTAEGEEKQFKLAGCEVRPLEERGARPGAFVVVPPGADGTLLGIAAGQRQQSLEWRYSVERAATLAKRASISKLTPEQIAALQNHEDDSDEDDAGGAAGPAPGPTDAAHCAVVLRSRRASTAGVNAVSPGQVVHFIVVARDAAGQDRTEGGDAFAVSAMWGNTPVEVGVLDNRDGTYGAHYTVPSAALPRRASMPAPHQRAPAPASAMKHAWLTRQERGFFGTSWKRRYFVLDIKARRLAFYTNQKAHRRGQPKGVVDLDAPGVRVEANRVRGSSRRNVFQLITPDITHNFGAGTPQQCQWWVEQLNGTAAPLPQQQPARPPPAAAAAAANPYSPANYVPTGPTDPGAAASATPPPAPQPSGGTRPGPGAAVPQQMTVEVSLDGQPLPGTPFSWEIVGATRKRGKSLATEMECFDVVLDVSGGQKLGMGLESEGDTPHMMLTVTDVHENGAAWKSGQVHIGDSILMIEGRHVAEIAFADIIELIKGCRGSCTMQLGRYVFNAPLTTAVPEGEQDKVAVGDQDALRQLVANPSRGQAPQDRQRGLAENQWGAYPMPPPWSPIAEIEQFAQWHRDQATKVLEPLQAEVGSDAPHLWHIKLQQWHKDAGVDTLVELRNAVAASDFAERVALCSLLGRAIDSHAELEARRRAQAAWSSTTSVVASAMRFKALAHKSKARGETTPQSTEKTPGRVLSPRERREQRRSERAQVR
eukprot:g645.t1